MGQDEVHRGICFRNILEQSDTRRMPQDRDSKLRSRVEHFGGRCDVKLQSTQAQFKAFAMKHVPHESLLSNGIVLGESDESLWVALYDFCNLKVGLLECFVGDGKNTCPIDPRLAVRRRISEGSAIVVHGAVSALAVPACVWQS